MDGFIPGSRGTLMLDFVAVAMIAVLPLMAFAVNLAKTGRYQSHRIMMLTISIVLAVTVLFFEIEMRLVGWKQLAEPSPYFETVVPVSLGIHLVCSVTTTLLLAAAVLGAVKNFPLPAKPGVYSAKHKKLGKASVLGLLLTSITGWIFYWCAFIAV